MLCQFAFTGFGRFSGKAVLDFQPVPGLGLGLLSGAGGERFLPAAVLFGPAGFELTEALRGTVSGVGRPDRFTLFFQQDGEEYALSDEGLLRRAAGQEPVPLPPEDPGALCVLEKLRERMVFLDEAAQDAAVSDALAQGRTLVIRCWQGGSGPLRELLDRWRDPQRNPQGAQLVLTASDPGLLSPALLRREEIWFTALSARQEAVLYSLAEFQGTEGGDWEGLYRQGRLSPPEEARHGE